MALDFPSSPANGQVYSNYYYDSTAGAWRSLGGVYGPNFLKNPTFTTGTTTSVPVTVQGIASQTANLQEWKNANSTVVSMTASGTIIGKTNTGGAMSANQDLGSLSVRGDATNAASITFHRPSLNWVGVGLDTDNTFKIGGGSFPASALSIDIAGRVRLPNQPSFLVYSNTGTAYKAAGSWEDISRLKTSGGVATAATRYNIGNHFDVSTGKFTAPVAGQYAFYAGGWATYNGAGNRYAVSFIVNGSGLNYISGANYSIQDSPLAMSPFILNLAANDYVVLNMFSSVATILGSGAHFFYYGGYLLG